MSTTGTTAGGTSSEQEEFWSLFVAEARDLLGEVERCLLDLEGHQRPEDIDKLYRLLHTLKGNSRLMGLGTLESLAHSAEDVVGLARDEHMELTPQTVDTLLGVEALLRELVEGAFETRADPDRAEIVQITTALGAIRQEWAAKGVSAKTRPNMFAKGTGNAGTEDGTRGDGEPEPLEFLSLLHAVESNFDRLEGAIDGINCGAPEAQEQLAAAVHTLGMAVDALGCKELRKCLGELDAALFRLDLEPEEAIREPDRDFTARMGELIDALEASRHPLLDERVEQLRQWLLERMARAAEELSRVLSRQAELPMAAEDTPLAISMCLRVARSASLAGMRPEGDAAWRLAGELRSWSRGQVAVPGTTRDATLEVLEHLMRGQHREPTPEAVIHRLQESLGMRESTSTAPADGCSAASPRVDSIEVPGGSPASFPLGATAGRDRGQGTSADASSAKASSTLDSAADLLLRVSSSKVTQLVDLAGEIGLATGALLNSSELRSLEAEFVTGLAHRLEGLVRELQDVSASLRLVPVGSVFQRLQRSVRDLSRKLGRPIVLEIRGEETEVDKVVVDRLFEPLMHMVRNAADHGLEPPEERAALGKPSAGRITLTAVQQASEIHISVADDGKGLNREKILARAKARGLFDENDEPKDDSSIWRFVLLPGFSTAEAVSELSGRGVGMDVVNAMVREFRGRINIESLPGKGTRFTLHVPLSLAFIQGMILEVQGMHFVVPVDAVSAVFRVEKEQVIRFGFGSSEMIGLRDEVIPVLWLQDFFQGFATRPPERSVAESVVVVVLTSAGRLAIPTDALLGNQQVIMKPLDGHLKEIRAAAGAGILRNGDVAIALDCERLSRSVAG